VSRYLLAEATRALLRLSAVLVLYGLLTAIPWPPGLARWVGVSAGAGLAAGCLIVVGVALYNTLFFDRHWRQVDTR
jgi:hypothetical protein